MRIYLWFESIITSQVLNGARPLIMSYGTRRECIPRRALPILPSVQRVLQPPLSAFCPGLAWEQFPGPLARGLKLKSEGFIEPTLLQGGHTTQNTTNNIMQHNTCTGSAFSPSFSLFIGDVALLQVRQQTPRETRGLNQPRTTACSVSNALSTSIPAQPHPKYNT